MYNVAHAAVHWALFPDQATMNHSQLSVSLFSGLWIVFENKDRCLKIISFAYWQVAERFHWGVHVLSVLLLQQIFDIDITGKEVGSNMC